MIIIYILLIILLLIFIGMYFTSLINNIIYKVPQVSTFNTDLKILREVFNNYDLNGKKIVDLGSGIGKMTRLFESEYKMKSTGYEIDFSNVLISKILNNIFKFKGRNIRGNYLKKDLSEFDFVYIYLFPVLMEKVEKKIWSNCKKGTIIFVNAFKFQNHEPIKIYKKNGKDKIFVYEV